MSKITVSQKGTSRTISYHLEGKEKIDQQQADWLTVQRFSGLIPFSIIKNFRGYTLQYDVSGLLTLKEYLSSNVTKEQFLAVVQELLSALDFFGKKKLWVKDIKMDCDSIFVSPQTHKLFFVYQPIQNNTNVTDLRLFFSSLPYQAVFASQDLSYVTKYIQYFQTQKSFAKIGVNKLVEALKGTEKALLKDEGAVCCMQADDRTSGFGDLTFEDDAPEAYGQQNYGTQAQAQAQESDDTIDIEDLNAGDQTMMLDDEDDASIAQPRPYPYLIREKTEESIRIESAALVIGKTASYADYVVADNRAVSRKHATIVTRADRYYIIDHDSSNRTYVDGKAIPSRQEYEIFSDTKIRLANEPFIFRVV